MSTWETDNIFKGTAWYYARYRPDYPEKVIKLLTEKFSLNNNSRLLDLGCGTGQIALSLAPYVSEIIAIDPQSEMLQEGVSLAVRKGIFNIRWLLGESSKLINMTTDIGCIDLAVLAQSFHWMDREQTLKDLYPLIKTGGGLALIMRSGPGGEPADNPWKVVIKETMHDWLGEVRKAGTKGTYIHPAERFEQTLQKSRFNKLESTEIKSHLVWTTDQIVGYLYSTSFASLPVLGGKKEQFEAELRRKLTSLNPSGLFEEDDVTEILMAWK